MTSKNEINFAEILKIKANGNLTELSNFQKLKFHQFQANQINY